MGTVRVKLIEMPAVDGVDLPTIEPRTYYLIDDDEKVCRVIDDAEFQAAYVDNHIDTFKLRNVDWLTLAVDREHVDIVYEDGRTASLLLGSIDYAPGPRAGEYTKIKGVIYPIDATGTSLFNDTNTPNLVAMRTWYWEEAKRVNDERIRIAEVVHSFAQVINVLGTARDTIRR
jgi:hypothetical protein